MIHNGVSSKAPYYEDAKRHDVATHGHACVWRPAGTGEEWLVPPEWVRKVTNRRGKVVRWEISQTGSVGDRLMSLPADEVLILRG